MLMVIRMIFLFSFMSGNPGASFDDVVAG
jgi:hypothetical protein